VLLVKQALTLKDILERVSFRVSAFLFPEKACRVLFQWNEIKRGGAYSEKEGEGI